MTITDSEEIAFRFKSLVYFYMWPFPVKLDYTNSKLGLNKPAVKWVPFVVTVFYVWTMG